MMIPTLKLIARALPVPIALATLVAVSLVSAEACTSSTNGGTTQTTSATATGASTTGGSTTSAASSGAGGADASPAQNCPAPEGPIDPTALIDDMEDGNGLLAPIDGRDGRWWAGGDATPGGVITPSGNFDPEMIPGGRCDSHYAMHVTGQGFNDWGAITQLPFRYMVTDAGEYVLAPYDASARQGVTFWARVGDTSTNMVRFAVADERARPEAGLCVVDGPPGETCYDTFGIALPDLDTEWKQYKVPFAGLSQRQFGVPGDSVDTKSIYTVEFAFDAAAVFDLWVDDIAFY